MGKVKVKADGGGTKEAKAENWNTEMVRGLAPWRLLPRKLSGLTVGFFMRIFAAKERKERRDKSLSSLSLRSMRSFAANSSSVSAGRAGRFDGFGEKLIEVPVHEQLTRQTGFSRPCPVKANQG